MPLYSKHFEKLKALVFSFCSATCVFLIRIYQMSFSAIFGGRCRYYPSCSVYCHECFSKFTLNKALRLSFRRLSSCHPMGGQGFDPVPFDTEVR